MMTEDMAAEREAALLALGDDLEAQVNKIIIFIHKNIIVPSS